MGADDTPPWRDEDVLRELYVEEQLSQQKIADRLGCDQWTVGKWLDRLGIEKRSRSEATSLGRGGCLHEVPYETSVFGRERWRHTYMEEKSTVQVHRLVAVAEYGLEEIRDKFIHHENEVPWDNRPENLTPIDPEEHSEYHFVEMPHPRTRGP